MGCGRRQHGAAMVFFVLALSALSGACLWWDLKARAVHAIEARGRASGAVFAQWLRAAHHLAQTEEARYRSLIGSSGGVAVVPATLRGAGLVPAWMPARTDAGQRITLGVIDDGRGVPMAFALASPTSALSETYRESFVAGAARSRVHDIAGVDREGQARRWRGAIENVLGRSLERGELYATADVGLTHDRRVLYRRAQPGHPGAAEMETALVFAGGAGISDIGGLAVLRAEVAEGLVVGTALRAGGSLVSDTAAVGGDVRVRHVEGQGLRVEAGLRTGHWNTAGVRAGGLAVRTELTAANAAVSGTVDGPGAFTIDRDLRATGVGGATLMSERVEAWRASGSLEVGGEVEAHYLAGEDAAFEGTVTVTGKCVGC